MTRTIGPSALGPLRLAVARLVSDVAQTQQKALGLATTAVALAFIARLTLKPMGAIFPTHFDWCLLCGSTGTADFILNIALFVPLGLGLRLSGVRRSHAWLFALALTLTIEALQYFVVPGRDSDISDIIANSAGGAIGIAMADLRRFLIIPSALVAGRLTAVSAFIVCVLAAAVQWALMPSSPHSVYYEQLAPDLPGYAVFNGTILDATFNESPIVIGRISADASAAMQAALVTGRASLATTFLPGVMPPDLAPIIAVHDARRREILLLARHADELMFRMRRRTDGLGFHTPSAVLLHALPADLPSSDTVSATTTVATGATTFDLTVRGPQHPSVRRLRVGSGVWDTWRLFLSDDGRWAFHVEAITLASMVLLFWPLGYWAGRAAPREGTGTSMAAALMPLVVSLAIIPWAAEAPIASAAIWTASVLSEAIAWTGARWVDV